MVFKRRAILLVQIEKMILTLNSSSPGKMRAVRQSANIGLAPSSLQTILKERCLPGIVLTDYDQNFTNGYVCIISAEQATVCCLGFCRVAFLNLVGGSGFFICTFNAHLRNWKNKMRFFYSEQKHAFCKHAK